MKNTLTGMPGLTLYLDDILDLQSSDLSYDELGRFLTLIFAYFTDGTEPGGLKGLERIAFRRFASKIDRNREKYDETCERNRANSRKKTAAAVRPAGKNTEKNTDKTNEKTAEKNAGKNAEEPAPRTMPAQTPVSPAADGTPVHVPTFTSGDWPDSPFHPEPGDEELTCPDTPDGEGELINISVYDDIPAAIPPARQPVPEEASGAPRSDVPTREEVKREIAQRGYTHSDNFFDYYASLGWRIGSAPIRSWKSALNVFERRGIEHDRNAAGADKRPAAPYVRPGSFLDYPQRPCPDRNDLIDEYRELFGHTGGDADIAAAL